MPFYIIPANEKIVTRFNKHRVVDLYNFPKYKKSKIKLIDLCNQVIHSYIFDPTFDEDLLLAGFWVTSDRQRNTQLFGLVLDDIIKVFETFGKDYPNSMSSIYDEKIKDNKIFQSMLTEDELKDVQIMHNRQINQMP